MFPYTYIYPEQYEYMKRLKAALDAGVIFLFLILINLIFTFLNFHLFNYFFFGQFLDLFYQRNQQFWKCLQAQEKQYLYYH